MALPRQIAASQQLPKGCTQLSFPGLKTWIAPLLVSLFAGILRFVNLGTPNAVVFDETYYAKDAWALLRFGVEHKAIDEHDPIMLAAGDNWRTVAGFTDQGSFVVHPPTGKWVIATGGIPVWCLTLWLAFCGSRTGDSFSSHDRTHCPPHDQI